ncbi:helix-turn-helix domain-containing protein [bacterium]|nr:helix-turn-helix domain-containing protein [bacterium]
MNNTLLNIQETARYLHVSISTLYRWVHRKEIQHIKIGSRVLFSQESLEEFIKNNTIEKDVA